MDTVLDSRFGLAETISADDRVASKVCAPALPGFRCLAFSARYQGEPELAFERFVQ
jgi:hypothetical protein